MKRLKAKGWEIKFYFLFVLAKKKNKSKNKKTPNHSGTDKIKNNKLSSP